MITSAPLESETLAAAVYNDSLQTLQLEFRDGNRYVYFGVNFDLFRALLAAPSKGRFFNQHIRRVLPYRRAAPRL